MKSFLLTLSILLAVLALLFWQSLRPGYVLFSNDGPLGSRVAERSQMPGNFAGGWDDLNWLGDRFVMPGPAISIGLRCLPCLPGRVLVLLAALFVGLVWRFCKLPNQTQRYLFAAACFTGAAFMVMSMVCHPAWLELLLPCSGFALVPALIIGELLNPQPL
jgi:hypothetical protein